MKNRIIAFVLALFSVFIFSEVSLFSTIILFPSIIWVIPFYFWFLLSVKYFNKVFGKALTVIQKIGIILISSLLLVLFLYGGFQFWKINSGNVLSVAHDTFQISVKNVWFWVLYQSYLMLFFFSGFKSLVTIDQK